MRTWAYGAVALGLSVGTIAWARTPAPDDARAGAASIPMRAEVGLSALVALSDGHMRGVADDLALIAADDDVRSGDWARIAAPLGRVRDANVAGAYWYAKPDGSYWTVDEGRAERRLSDRAHFQAAMAGRTVVGDLVVSRSTGRNVGIVAVPVKGKDGAVAGVLGASVYLDRLSAQLREELGLGRGEHFYAFDAEERVALHPDSPKIFVRAEAFGPEVQRAFGEMRERGEGFVRYTYEDRPRTLIYRRSDVTGWWYAFGVLGEVETKG